MAACCAQLAVPALTNVLKTRRNTCVHSTHNRQRHKTGIHNAQCVCQYSLSLHTPVAPPPSCSVTPVAAGCGSMLPPWAEPVTCTVENGACSRPHMHASSQQCCCTCLLSGTSCGATTTCGLTACLPAPLWPYQAVTCCVLQLMSSSSCSQPALLVWCTTQQCTMGSCC